MAPGLESLQKATTLLTMNARPLSHTYKHRREQNRYGFICLCVYLHRVCMFGRIVKQLYCRAVHHVNQGMVGLSFCWPVFGDTAQQDKAI